MEIKYNVKGTKREELVNALAGITGEKSKYQNAPTFAYKVGQYTVTRDGSLQYPDDIDATKVIEGLSGAGFKAESQDNPTGLIISIPCDKVNVENLTRLIDAKSSLIKKALGIDALPIEVTDDAVSFPWFKEMPDADTTQAFIHLITAMCQMSLEQKRVTVTAKEVENERYAFRCFLLRLGFIGPEYKIERKVLLKNLEGSSAFKEGQKNDISK